MPKTKCVDCGERPATTSRDNESVCDPCAVEWDKPLEMHEPTIARVRRDVSEYKTQAAWLDTWSLLRMFDQTRADLARALPVVEAAGALVPLIDPEMFHHDQSDCRCPARFDQGKHEDYCAANPCGSECFRCALDALARAVDAGKGTG